jgi:excisionase family DNA binding protein
MNNHASDEFVSVKAAARILNVPADYVMELLAAKTLPYTQRGEECLLPKAPLEAYRKKTYIEANKALDFIAREAREMGLYD